VPPDGTKPQRSPAPWETGGRRGTSRPTSQQSIGWTDLLHLYAKLDVSDRAAAVAAAYERGLLTPGQLGRE
jgi:hypothetical protein